MEIIVNTDAKTLSGAIVDTLNPLTPADISDKVINDSLPVDIYFQTGGSNTDWSGDLSYEIRVAIGEPGAVPKDGTFTLLDDGAAETGLLLPSSTSSNIQDALNALNGTTGPDGGLVDVSKGGNGYYTVKRRDFGDFPELSSDGSLLSPESVVMIDELVEGSISTKQIQVIRVVQLPFSITESWTQITDPVTSAAIGYRGELNLSNSRMLDFLAGLQKATAYFEVEVTNPTGQRITYAQTPITIRAEVINSDSFDATRFPGESANYLQNRYGITGLTGGTSTDLDGIATVSRKVGTLVAVEYISGTVTEYRLEAGTDAESSPDIIRPDDYAGGTNEKVWKRKLSAGLAGDVVGPSSATDNAIVVFDGVTGKLIKELAQWITSATYGTLRGTIGLASTVGFALKVTGDAFDRFVISAAGKMNWGDGSGSADTTLERTASGTLEITDTLNVTSTITENGVGVVKGPSSSVDNEMVAFDSTTGKVIKRVTRWIVDATSGFLTYTGSIAGVIAMQTQVTADTYKRFIIVASGGMFWGSGSATQDTTLARSGVGELTLTGKLVVTDNITGKTQEEIGLAVSDEVTDLTTGTAKITFRMPYAMTLTEVRANVNTAPVGSTIIVDINESGTTVLSTKLSIDASEKTSTTAATPPVISDSALADDAEITIDIDQVGSSTAGKGLKIWLIGRRA